MRPVLRKEEFHGRKQGNGSSRFSEDRGSLGAVDANGPLVATQMWDQMKAKLEGYGVELLMGISLGSAGVMSWAAVNHALGA